MTAIIIKDNEKAPPANTHKDGEYYDRCPEDGCLEVDRVYKAGGRDARGEEHLDYSIFTARMQEGGCGASWARTTKQGADRERSNLGREPKWLTRTAATERVVSVPSERFRQNYDQIQWGR